jgi:ADP-ribose pyrophosphatase YjhB (NUDIX family)
MIQFDEGNNRFNYRIVGVATHNDRVLLHRADGEQFWTLPGGRGELGETAEQTLRREFVEELDTEIEVVRLLWFVENFFTYDGRDYHELALYFLIRLPALSRYLRQDRFNGWEKNTTLFFQWFPQEPAVLEELPLLPAFLQNRLQALPTSAEHVVHIDEKT